MWIELEHALQRRLEGLRIAEVDAVPVLVAPESEFEAGRVSMRERFRCVDSLANTARNSFGSGPEGGGQAAFAGERRDHGVLRHVRQQAQ